jgi:glycopeptide antibiotics resistance protein
MLSMALFALQNSINLYVIVPGLVLMIVLLWRMRLTRSRSYRFFFALFWIYLLMLVNLLVFSITSYRQITWDDRLEMLPLLLSRVNLFPLHFGRFPMSAYVLNEMGLNILVTVPLGFGLAFLKPLPPLKMLLGAVATGLFFEIGQFAGSFLTATPARVTDINDVIFNGLGVMLGYGVFFLLKRWAPRTDSENATRA